MLTVIIYYLANQKQHYIRLLPGSLDGAAKDQLCASLQAVNAGTYDYSQEPGPDVNRLYFQEFEQPDTDGYYFNINGDRPVYEIIGKGQDPDYSI